MTYSINEVTPIPADTKKEAYNDEKPLEPSSTATSSTCANSNGGPDMLSDADGEKHLGHQSYLRSYGRPDVRREPKRFFGWTLARWLLLISISLLMLYGLIFLIGCLVTFAKGYYRAIVIIIADRDILNMTFAASVLCVITACVGLVGVWRKDRRILGIYALLLWPCFALIATVGYLSYKADTWNLRAQLGTRWRHEFTDQDHIALQDNLHCCGFENPSDHATYYDRCFTESLLPGCSYKFYLFEHDFLVKAWTTTFALVPLHVIVIIISLLCSNHVDHLFGSRSRPPIAYLGRFHDWRDWEKEQDKFKQEKIQASPKPITDTALTNTARSTGTLQATSRHSYFPPC
ncbi:hypothetical protein LRAMOSA08834 [Lichtheimia ramosa]|uniref:Tetraspanin Tsp2 n=1 Tax=Lichtheimia ramosa TaxID=688394 RepID=A0A077WF96_9FUNG|nr:hypothetical protein LRAMOSA08834 [Lichtheimia ramosa]